MAVRLDKPQPQLQRPELGKGGTKSRLPICMALGSHFAAREQPPARQGGVCRKQLLVCILYPFLLYNSLRIAAPTLCLAQAQVPVARPCWTEWRAPEAGCRAVGLAASCGLSFALQPCCTLARGRRLPRLTFGPLPAYDDLSLRLKLD
jgi:hypothetical protein